MEIELVYFCKIIFKIAVYQIKAHHIQGLYLTDGFLIECSLNPEDRDTYFRSHWLQYTYDGALIGVFPFLGAHPRCLLPVFIDPDPNEKNAGDWVPGWYLYALDGHGNIICVKPVVRNLLS